VTLALIVWVGAMGLIAALSLGWTRLGWAREGLWLVEWLAGVLAYALVLLALLPAARHLSAAAAFGLLAWSGLAGAALGALLVDSPQARPLGLWAALTGPLCWLALDVGLQIDGTAVLLMVPYALVSLGLMGLVTLPEEEEEAVAVAAGAPRSTGRRPGRRAAPRTRATGRLAGSSPRR
jgi:hypothetical protein